MESPRLKKSQTVCKTNNQQPSTQQEGHLRAVGPASGPKLDVWGELQKESHGLWPLALVGAELAGGGVALLEAELVVGVGVGKHHPLVDCEK